jgi:hypothetical protein
MATDDQKPESIVALGTRARSQPETRNEEPETRRTLRISRIAIRATRSKILEQTLRLCVA